MNNNFDKSLQDLLSNHTEQPPLDCWDKILSRLDAVQATDAGSATHTASKFSQWVGSTVGKIAITTTIAAGVGTAVYFVVKENDEIEQTVQQQDVFTTEQDTVLLYQEYVAEEFVENEMEKVLSSAKNTSTHNTASKDTAMEKEKKMEELPTVVNPTMNYPVNQSDLNVTNSVSSPQPKVTEQQQHHSQPTKKETIVEPIKEEKLIAENNEETGGPKQPSIRIPTIFTPNGDSENDYFVIDSIEQIPENQLDIYTRNGRVVYSKRFYDNRWDARGLPDGVYFYIFRFEYEGNQLMRRGSITVRR